ncbi:MAG: TasA family protein, partial [Bacillota bacterium]|nr:TasA family protein [Bacillota bacterium]
MNKKLLSSLLIIALAIAAIGGGALAWFTDAAETPTNTFVAGVLSMDVDDVFDWEDNTFDDFEPGTEVDKNVQITNTGTKQMYLKAEITETLYYTLHFNETEGELVKYLPALNPDGTSTGERGTFEVVGGELQYD